VPVWVALSGVAVIGALAAGAVGLAALIRERKAH
jgi:hypothetical protein